MGTRKVLRSDTYAKGKSSDIDRGVSKQHEYSIKGSRNERESEARDDQRPQERNGKQLPGRQRSSDRGCGYRSVRPRFLELFWSFGLL